MQKPPEVMSLLLISYYVAVVCARKATEFDSDFLLGNVESNALKNLTRKQEFLEISPLHPLDIRLAQLLPRRCTLYRIRSANAIL